MFDNNKVMVLHNWDIRPVSTSRYQAPELIKMLAYGNVYGNPYFNEGYPIHTSYILKIDLLNKFIITNNSRYELGKINREYLNWCIDNNVDNLDLIKNFEVYSSKDYADAPEKDNVYISDFVKANKVGD